MVSPELSWMFLRLVCWFFPPSHLMVSPCSRSGSSLFIPAMASPRLYRLSFDVFCSGKKVSGMIRLSVRMTPHDVVVRTNV